MHLIEPESGENLTHGRGVTARSLARPDASPRLVRRWSRRPADAAGVGRRRSGLVPCLPACPAVGRHGQRAHGVSVDQHVGGATGGGRQTCDVEQGNEVVGCRDRHTEIGMVPQMNHVPRGRAHQIPGGVVGAPRPLEPGLRLCPVDAPKVVDHVATADDEHPSGAVRRPPRAGRGMLAPKCLPCLGVPVAVERVHGVAMAQERGGHGMVGHRG
jgi:hypothetical protein